MIRAAQLQKDSGFQQSNDTFDRIFDRLSPRAFTAAFQRWMQAKAVGIKQIAIDNRLESLGHKVTLEPNTAA